MSEYIIKIENDVRNLTNGQLNLDEYQKSSEYEFICRKLQFKLDELIMENKCLVDKIEG